MQKQNTEEKNMVNASTNAAQHGCRFQKLNRGVSGVTIGCDFSILANMQSQ